MAQAANAVDGLTDDEVMAALRLLKQRDPKFSIEAFAGSHVPQLRFLRDRSHRKHVMCARQSGKSQGCDALMLDRALSRQNSTWLLLGLTGPAVRNNNWEPIWTRLFSRFRGLDPAWNNDTRMVCKLPNGSRVLFAGTDDARHIKNILGGRLDGGGIIIDECQDQGAVLDELLDSILPPMMSLTSELVLAGVIPEVAAGRFYRESKTSSWSAHRWGRLANTHTPEAAEVLERYLADTGLTADDPQIQRDWHGAEVFDPTATAYRYDQAKNGYSPAIPHWLLETYNTRKHNDKDLAFCHPIQEDKTGVRHGLIAAEPFDGVRMYSFAIDPGSDSDRASIEGIGWGDKSRDVQQVFEWSTPRAARLTTGQIYAVASLANYHFSRRGGIVSWRYDAGSSQNTIDNLQVDYGLPVILAAKKADLEGQVKRSNDLMAQGRDKIIIGSALEQDLQRARWDKKALETGQHKWSGSWHPDPSEAKRYATQDYFNAYQAPVKPTIFDNPALKALLTDVGGDRPNYR